MFVSFCRMLDENTAPTGRAVQHRYRACLPADNAHRQSLALIAEPFQSTGQPRISADIQCTLDQASVQLGDAHQGYRVAAYRRAKVLDNLFPIQVPMLGIDDYPVQSKGDRDLGDAG